jgi:hypothetical protein
MVDEQDYITPKARFMCDSCFDKDKCKKDIFEMQFCKSDQLTALLRKNNQLLTELLEIIKKANGGMN